MFLLQLLDDICFFPKQVSIICLTYLDNYFPRSELYLQKETKCSWEFDLNRKRSKPIGQQGNWFIDNMCKPVIVYNLSKITSFDLKLIQRQFCGEIFDPEEISPNLEEISEIPHHAYALYALYPLYPKYINNVNNVNNDSVFTSRVNIGKCDQICSYDDNCFIFFKEYDINEKKEYKHRRLSPRFKNYY